MSLRSFVRALVVLALTAAVVPSASVLVAGTISLAWDPVTHPDLGGYRVYHGTSPGSYAQSVDTGTSPQVTLSNLADCTNHYVAVKARSTDGSSESPLFSNEIVGWPRPVVTAANPASVARGSQVAVTLSGVNFMPGATVSVSNPAVSVTGVTVNGCNELVVNLNVSGTGSLGAADVTVVNPDQVFGTGAGILGVTNAAPDGTITQPASDVTIEEGQSVSFAGSASDPDNNTPLGYQWTFGDPAIADSTQQNPGSVRFDNAGSWQVRLTVSDSLGLADPTPATVTVHVNAAQAPVISGVAAGPVGSTTATITWTTDRLSDSQVLYRIAGDTVDQLTPVDSTMVTSHSVTLVGLMPNKQYAFSVRSADSNGLTTTQAAAAPFTTQSNSFAYVRIEAESGAVSAPAETQVGTDAFAGAYIRLAPGTSTGTAASPAGTWNYGFHAPSPATWYVWFRMYAPNASSATWFERVNGGSFAAVAPTTIGTWEWVAGRSYGLAAGSHVLTLGGGEARARIDRVLITNDASFVPTEAPGGDTTPPAPVSALTAQPDDATVALSWTNPTDAGPLRVVVRYSTGGSSPTHPGDGLPLIDRTASGGAADSVLHTGLVNGTTYRYGVFVVDAWGNASVAATVEATPQEPVVPLGQVDNLRRTDKLSP